MQRRTITIPDDVGARIDDLVGGGAFPSVSAFFQDAARSHLAALDGGVKRSAATVHPAPRTPEAAPRRSPWGRLG